MLNKDIQMTSSPHNFHIPVMGLAYTVDTPIKVARYGINSVISIIEDKLIELMRKHYYEKYEIPYVPISASEEDYREFVTTVIYHPHLALLPEPPLKQAFIDQVTVLASREAVPFTLDYWRLNIRARKP